MIEMYEAARNESVDPDIRRYADIMLPALRDNREQAVAMFNKQLGVSSAVEHACGDMAWAQDALRPCRR